MESPSGKSPEVGRTDNSRGESFALGEGFVYNERTMGGVRRQFISNS